MVQRHVREIDSLGWGASSLVNKGGNLVSWPCAGTRSASSDVIALGKIKTLEA
jgi:hypothetical protein